ncbi:MAG: hypothetical protein ACR2OU_00400, partial [Thermomicrobiales bacterium]
EAIISGEEQRDDVIDGVLVDIRASGALDRAEAIAAEYSETARARIAIVPDAETREFLDTVVNRT